MPHRKWYRENQIPRTRGKATGKKLLLIGAFLFQGAPAVAQVYAPDASGACGTIADDRARLACYDSARGKQTGARPAPDISPRPAPAQSSVDAFGGMSVPTPARPAVPSRLSVGVASYTFNTDHKFVVTLDNGQVWRQFLDDTGTAKFKTNEKNYVVIRHVFWHSYDLKLNTMNAAFRVQRMK